MTLTKRKTESILLFVLFDPICRQMFNYDPSDLAFFLPTKKILNALGKCLITRKSTSNVIQMKNHTTTKLYETERYFSCIKLLLTHGIRIINIRNAKPPVYVVSDIPFKCLTVRSV